jgi:hypothetical protein
MTLVKIPYNENKTNDKGYYLNNQCEGKTKTKSLNFEIEKTFFRQCIFSRSTCRNNSMWKKTRCGGCTSSEGYRTIQFEITMFDS